MSRATRLASTPVLVGVLLAGAPSGGTADDTFPAFVELGDLEVVVDGQPTALGSSGLVYHRGSPDLFDDPDTPEHDGISERSQQYLACEVPSWTMGQQTFTVDLIELGIHRGDQDLIDKGVTGVNWGISVPINDQGVHTLHRACDDSSMPDYGGTHHTTQWLESMGRAVYLLAASDLADDYEEEIAAYVDRIETLAALLTREDNWEEWRSHVTDSNGDDFTHRTFMMAAALQLASSLTDDEEAAMRWSARAHEIARYGIGNQRPDGVNPERGGYDVQYQMYGLWLAEVFYTVLDDDDPLKPEVESMIDDGIAWYLPHINMTDGRIDIGESTRVCAEENWWSGAKTERLDAREAVRAMLLWGQLKDDDELVRFAATVSDGHLQHGNPCPGQEDRATGAATSAAGTVATTSGDRGFDTPIGRLSARRVLAAGAAALLVFLALTPLGFGLEATRQRVLLRACIAVVVAAVVLVLLAA